MRRYSGSFKALVRLYYLAPKLCGTGCQVRLDLKAAYTSSLRPHTLVTYLAPKLCGTGCQVGPELHEDCRQDEEQHHHKQPAVGNRALKEP